MAVSSEPKGLKKFVVNTKKRNYAPPKRRWLFTSRREVTSRNTRSSIIALLFLFVVSVNTARLDGWFQMSSLKTFALQIPIGGDPHATEAWILRSHSLRVVNKTSLKMPVITCVDCYWWACYANTSVRKIQRPVKTENVENWLSALWVVSCSEKWRSSAIMIERKWRGKCSFLCWFYVQVFFSDIFRRSRQYRFLLNSCII